MINKKTIIVSKANLYNSIDKLNTLETQCLFGEKVKIIQKFSNYSLCECEQDGYVGYIQNEALGDMPMPTNKVTSPFTLIYSQPSEQSLLKEITFLNSKISLKKIVNKKWAECYLKCKTRSGYILKDNLDNYKTKKESWLSVAKKFLGTPYLWGGKTSLGIDCSGLVQMCLFANNIKMPRNTSEQINFVSSKVKNIDSVKKGSLIFWRGHVAIALSKSEIIHSNAYHMSVKIEKLNDALKRFEKNNYEILKIKKILI